MLVSNVQITRDELIDLLAASHESLSFENCTFDGQDLSGLELEGLQFSACGFLDTRFTRAHLQDTVWQRCKLGQVDFSLADLSSAHFRVCDLHLSKWVRAQIASLQIEDSKLSGAIFNETRGLDLSLRECKLVGATLRAINFRKQTLVQLDFSDADLGGCDFQDAVFEGGSLRGASLRGVNFKGTDLRSVELGSISLYDLNNSFQGACLSVEQAVQLVSSMGVQVQ
ncbi:MAG: pentapeptide repeat-containing protein [Alcaligenes aquatilis]